MRSPPSGSGLHKDLQLLSVDRDPGLPDEGPGASEAGVPTSETCLAKAQLEDEDKRPEDPLCRGRARLASTRLKRCFTFSHLLRIVGSFGRKKGRRSRGESSRHQRGAGEETSMSRSHFPACECVGAL